MRAHWPWIAAAVLSIGLGGSAPADTAPESLDQARADEALSVPETNPHGAADTDGFEPFPDYDTIRGNVEFWKRTYAEWTLGQFAIHDHTYPDVVYEVVDLSGPVAERLAKEQGEFIKARRELWKARLARLEDRVAAGLELADEEKTWALALITHGGSQAVEGAAERVRSQRGLRERFRRGLEIGAGYDGILREIFREAGLPEDLAILPHVESSFQTRARSSAGAVGVWQFTRGTGKRYLKITSGVDERLDPIAAARGAARYLADAFADLQDWPIALTSYNHGVAGMGRAIESHGRDYESIFRDYDGRWFGFASKNFYAEFLAAREIVRNVERHFPEGLNPEPPLDLDRLTLDQRTTPGRVARAYDLPLDELAELNPAWTRRAVKSGYALPSGLDVWLPKGTLERVAREGRTPSLEVAGWIDDDGHYVVQPGDALSMIAETYGISVGHLRRLNGMAPGKSLIRVGQRLRLSNEEVEQIHVVRRGDTLSSIAQTYRMSLSELRGMNGMPGNASLIRSGTRLRVRAPEHRVHTVRRGDSLARIAGNYGVRLSELLSLNRLRLNSIIHPGQSIRIPTTR